jgi:hypothetical protein
MAMPKVAKRLLIVGLSLAALGFFLVLMAVLLLPVR